MAVIAKTVPDDWQIFNAQDVLLNGKRSSEKEARRALSSTRVGVVSVTLVAAGTDQDFEFSFRIANTKDLDGVEKKLGELVEGRALTISAIDTFITRTNLFESARNYRDGLANYFFGVLARERSTESGLLEDPTAYRLRFDEAVELLGKFDRPSAEAICGLVSFHYNQFDLALRKTRSPRVARVSRRFAMLLQAKAVPSDALNGADRASLDYVLSDTQIERIVSWCSIRLDGSAINQMTDIEGAITEVQPTDATKLRIIAAEHYLAAGEPARGLEHVSALRHARPLETWSAWCRARAGKIST